MTAIPAGGDLRVTVSGTQDAPDFEIRCQGRGARIPQGIVEMFSGEIADIDPRSVAGYYAARLAQSSRMTLTVKKDGADIVFTVESDR